MLSLAKGNEQTLSIVMDMYIGKTILNNPVCVLILYVYIVMYSVGLVNMYISNAHTCMITNSTLLWMFLSDCSFGVTYLDAQ